MTQQYQHILVPVDGSKEAELAFKKAVAVALRNGADTELQLLHVVDTRAFQNVSSFDSSMVEQVTKTAKQTLDQYVDYAKKQGLTNVSYTIEYGAPIMIRSACIFSGTSREIRVLIGSVTEYVTRMAICDVLVVRTDLDNQPTSFKKH